MLRIRGLRVGYSGKEVLHGIDLAVELGSWTVLLGPNGSGKTTTFKTIMGQLRPMGGEVMVDGRDCWRDSLPIKRLVGYLPEEVYCYTELTGRENLGFVGDMHEIPRRELRERIERLTQQFALAGDLDRATHEYSLGMKRKLGVCMALLHNPRFLILDEPTNGLDPVAAETFRSTLTTLRKEANVTILMSTHNMGMLHRYCDTLFILHEGVIRFTGKMAAVLAGHPGLSLEEFFLRTVGLEPSGEGQAEAASTSG